MKVLILAGGFGTRLSEETDVRPKPMVEIGGKPILWHIMKMYSQHGFNEFVILLGYKGYYIKEYFANYFLHQSDITIDLKNNEMKIHKNTSEPWTVTLLDTGLHSMTGGRIKRAQEVVGDEPFMLTYGDGVSDVDVNALVEFHNSHEGAITMTSVQPDGRFGAIEIEGDRINRFLEKPKGDGSWINGGFFVCESKVFDYIKLGDQTVFEQEPLQSLAEDQQLYSYKHHGFWKCMDTLKDRNDLDKMYTSGTAKWKTW
ncbi:glucose-1-phosphate cytidylyltransferase [Vibrio caribbeanicus]|uniref:Glucose-1-phosphate cytidylyltransferase n=1 Tax=Vibrio caribbeanicus TaxID=701175 RepID=A0ACC4NSK9_9VIBR|nr:glucose-1-phosphate cytidylyltransferase [Vibrio caribbeanicus]KHD23471.1 glucose-1-phosphate cytidylyltransferase [Vibrio caribbeanicus]